jgi:hypothetical protein
MARKNVPVARQLAVVLIAACGFTLVACERQAASQTFGIGTHHTRCIVVLQDETGSDIGDWNAMREQISKIASRLVSDDAFTVIAINDYGGEAGNVRVPLTSLHAGPLEMAKLKHQRDAIIQQVRSLTPRGRPQKTDIVGAIRQAQDTANKARAMAKQANQHADMDTVLAFFSDMQQTPRMPKPADFAGIRFPEGTKGYCFYVAAPGKNGIQSTVAIWRPLLNSAGIAITENDFHQQGTVEAAIESAFH